jgi:hypothetical protein
VFTFMLSKGEVNGHTIYAVQVCHVSQGFCATMTKSVMPGFNIWCIRDIMSREIRGGWNGVKYDKVVHFV